MRNHQPPVNNRHSQWYQQYFTKEYWQFAELHASTVQVAEASAYLQSVLKATAPGRRVADLGCGVGGHALALAQAGFTMTGLDISAWAIAEACQRAAAAGLQIEWGVVDLLAEADWPLTEVDAAICVDAFGWGSDADQRRLLRRLRRYLAPNGVIILVHPNLSWTIRHQADSVSAILGEVTYTWQQRYDPCCGRRRGALTIADGDKPERVFAYDQRLYTATELMTLLRNTGFTIHQLDADFQPHNPVQSDTQVIQLCARMAPTPPTALAVASWATPPDQRLDLRYASDEAEWLAPTPTAIWETVIEHEPQRGAEAVGYYPVNDPYGGERAAPVVSAYFGCPLLPHQVTVGPGVTALLHDLCDLADGGLVLGPQLIHPDLTVWALARGLDVHLVEEPANLARLITAIQEKRPALVQLDRPQLYAGLMTLDDLYTLSLAAAQVGAKVLVDESPATYLGPTGSAVPLIQRLDNLVVLRGLTKAYSWGGLRVGFAFASAPISARVRELVCPLQMGELALRAALRLLTAGDIFQPLRARIRTVKPQTIRLLRASGFAVDEGHPELPWVIMPDEGGATTRRLEQLGIRGLRFTPSPAICGPYPEKLLLFSPLSEERLALLRRHLEGAFANRANSILLTTQPPTGYQHQACQSQEVRL